MIPRRSRRAGFLAASILALCGLAAVALGGCGGGGGGHFVAFGTIEVENHVDSFWGIDSVEVEGTFGPLFHYDVFLAPGEFVDIDVDPDDYDIWLFWSNGDVDLYQRFVAAGELEFIIGLN